MDGTVDDFVWQLTTGYWAPYGGGAAWNVSPGADLSVDLSGLDAIGTVLARDALALWSAVSGIGFVEVTGNADITFTDDESGAYASYAISGGAIQSVTVNVAASWHYGTDRTDSYAFQTYLHEIGHALGLGHAGNYNGSSSYPDDALWDNDSWQMTVMSYFSQTQNTSIDASYAFAITPMIADIAAIGEIYGSHAAFAGDTVYGAGGNTGTVIDDWLSYARGVTLTLTDGGGTDLIDLSTDSAGQRIDLRAEAISDVLGLTGNLVIARNTVIENARTGDGGDHVTGNDASNRIETGGGDDTAFGGAREDTLIGGDGADWLDGGAGFDWLEGDGGHDTLLGGDQADTLLGGPGNDRLEGQNGNDRLGGGTGNDTLDGGTGDDVLRGDAQEDTLIGGAGHDLLYGGPGFDLLQGGDGDDTLMGEAQADNLYGGDGADTLHGGDGFDRLFGGGGADTAFGDAGGDALFGETGDDSLDGGAGDDRVWGGTGNDSVSGGDGNDTLRGGAGFDRLDGGAGDDTLTGDFNADTFVFADGCGRDVITDFDALNPYEKIDLTGIGTISDFTTLMSEHVTVAGSDCLLDFSATDQVLLRNVSVSDLDATDFIF